MEEEKKCIFTLPLEERRKYNNKWVAFISFWDRTIVGHGKSPEEAQKKASQKGYDDPMLSFIVPDDQTWILSCPSYAK